MIELKQKIFKTKPDGVRRVGRQKLRWELGILCRSRHENITKKLRIGRRPPSTETNGQSFLRRPGPTKGCEANDDDYEISRLET